ncbi:MAG: hypothetical protein Q9214_006293, partial [Letrouitia sp. 1 TL-2023]
PLNANFIDVFKLTRFEFHLFIQFINAKFTFFKLTSFEFHLFAKAVTWNIRASICYLKFAAGSRADYSSTPRLADAARRISVPSSSSSSTRSSTSSASSTSSSISSLVPLPTFPSCPRDDRSIYYDSLRYGYQLRCNQDIPGYDLIEGTISTGIADCVEKCKGYYPRCRAITYVPSRTLSCYLKSQQGPYTTQSFEADSAIIVIQPALILRRQQESTESASDTDTDTAAASDSAGGYVFPNIAADTANVPSLPQDPASNINSTDLTATTAASTENNGVSYTPLTDRDGKLQLTSSDSGSLSLSPVSSTPVPGTVFASYNGMIVADSQDRLLHYYAPTMTAYGVSRLRVATLDHMPNTARLLSLAPIDFDNDPGTPSMVVAVDTQGGSYYLVLCTFDGGADKMFVVRDVDQGVDVLQSEEVRYTITGGVVKSCGPVALGGNGGFGTE